MGAVLAAWSWGWWCLQAAKPVNEGLPFGLAAIGDNPATLTSCDFFAHHNYWSQQWARAVERPYTLDDQMVMVRRWHPGLQAGMPYAYTPTILLLGAPLAALPPLWAHAVFVLLNYAMLAALAWWLIGRRLETKLQLWVAVITIFSLATASAFINGLTQIATTFVLGGMWWALRGQRQGEDGYAEATWRGDLILAAALWALSAKPNLWVLGAAMLAAACRWRAMALGSAAAAATFLVMSPWVGGFPGWMADYVRLLSEYHRDAAGTLRAGMEVDIMTNLQGWLDWAGIGTPAFALRASGFLWLGTTAGLVGLAWIGRLGAARFLAFLLGTYGLISPNVTVNEDVIFVLLAMESGAARLGHPGGLALFFLFGAMNFRGDVPIAGWGLPLAVLCKTGLLACWLAGAGTKRQRSAGG